MEEQSGYNSTKSFRRLLVFIEFIFIGFACYSQSNLISFSQINQLRVMPGEEQKLYTGQDIRFELFIPNVQSSKIQILNYPELSGTFLRTSRKSDVYGEKSGTLIELWYNFEKEGNYQFPSIGLYIQNRKYYVKFEPITIQDDPASKFPRLVLQFDNGVTIYSDVTQDNLHIFNSNVGKKISFTVSVQYAMQVLQFDWEIPKNSIFTKKKSYEITELRPRERNYTSDLIPVADFEWTVLSKGEYELPALVMVCTGYNGYRNELTLPDFVINFDDKVQDVIQNDSIDIYANAFDESYYFDELTQNLQITQEMCQKLALLRHKERTDIVNHLKIKKQRIEFEKDLNIPYGQSEFFMGFYYLSLLFMIFFVFLLILVIKNKKVIEGIVFSISLLGVIAFFVYTFVQKNKVYAISGGITVFSIPEENANVSLYITEGTRVFVKEIAGDWIYIQTEQQSGWCRKQKIYFIY